MECPACGHAITIKREEIIPFDNFKDWDSYIRHNMSNATRQRKGKQTVVHASHRIIARWDGVNYGFVAEVRFNHLARIAFRGTRHE